MEVIFVMSESNKYIISVEVLKYPYCGKSIESEEFLSEKICCSTIKVRKKIIKKAKWLIVYGDFVLRLTNGVVPSQAIGLAIPPQTPAIMRSIHSNADLSKQAIIAQVIQQMPAKIDFTQKEMNELYHLSVECKNNSLSQEELITKITNLRGGSFVDVAAGLAIIAAIIILANNANGFQPNPHVNVPPHLQWLYGNNYQPGQFGYGKSTNPLILDFLKVLEGFYSWESIKIYPYIQALTDQVFLGSSKFYPETMRKFVSGELNALEFTRRFSKTS